MPEGLEGNYQPEENERNKEKPQQFEYYIITRYNRESRDDLAPHTTVLTFPTRKIAEEFVDQNSGIFNGSNITSVADELPPEFGSEGVMYEPHGFEGGYGVDPSSEVIANFPIELTKKFMSLELYDEIRRALIALRAGNEEKFEREIHGRKYVVTSRLGINDSASRIEGEFPDKIRVEALKSDGTTEIFYDVIESNPVEFKKQAHRHKPEVGDYVSTGTAQDNFFRQGVFIRDNGDGTAIIRTLHYGGKEIVVFKEGMTIVKDKNLNSGCLELVVEQRKNAGLL